MQSHEAKAKKEQFIFSRALEGKSFDLISRELEVSKPTLIKWERDYNQAIKQIENADIALHLNEYKMSLMARFELLSSILKKLSKEIEKRDFSDLDSEKLIKLFLTINGQVQEFLHTNSPEPQSIYDDF